MSSSRVARAAFLRQRPQKMRRRRRRRLSTSSSLLFLILLVWNDFCSTCCCCHGFTAAFHAHSSFSRARSHIMSSSPSSQVDPMNTDAASYEVEMDEQSSSLASPFSSRTRNIKQNRHDDDDDDARMTTTNTHLLWTNLYKNSTDRTLTPYHVLHPTAVQAAAAASTTSGSNTILNRPKPLFRVLQLVRDALKVMQEQQQQRTSSSSNQIWRLEHQVVVETADPLAWLTQQKDRIDHASASSSRSNQEALFYFASQEGDFEVAAVGSIATLDKTAPMFQTSWQQALPASSRWYGGERFAPCNDDDDDNSISDDWKEFGKEALWILPKIELVQQQQQTAGTKTTTTSTCTTLAVHVWQDDIQNTLDLLQRLTEDQAYRQPPTTLPPVLSRDSNYDERSRGARRQPQDDDDYDDDVSSTSTSSSGIMDGQDHYEQAVATALEHLTPLAENTQEKTTRTTGSSSSSSSNHTMESSSTSADSYTTTPTLFKKVVLARKHNLHLGVQHWTSLSLLQRWKYGHLGEGGGHLFWMRPPSDGRNNNNKEFFGCTPERLFQIKRKQVNHHGIDDDDDDEADDIVVESEALAGTRPRGSTAAADAELLRELFDSDKDMQENRLTGQYIEEAFDYMHEQGWVQFNQYKQNKSNAAVLDSTARTFDSTTAIDLDNNDEPSTTSPEQSSPFFVRRLLHVQHLCRTYSAKLHKKGMGNDHLWNVSRHLLTKLHPTPAVCGVPLQEANEFIRERESSAFDRGFYSGPIGYIGRQEAHIVVAIRSGLVTHPRSDARSPDATNTAITNGRKGDRPQTTISLFAGAGIVPGSTVKGEWAETNYKLSVISSLFPQSPITLQGAPTPNAAWATAFVEELIRNGVMQFYICPGSRSTPLVVAVARAVRTHSDVVHAVSVHDERAAAFRALGYARGGGTGGRCSSSSHAPAAIITSSGTAVANLYPAVVEASMDGVPLLLLTADRPYESRDIGQNQAIDQVKVFSPTYIRWHRDVLPPSDDVSISLALADAGHAVDVSRRLRGPVHLNLQFRENLAPDSGPIRNDGRKDAITTFNANLFTSAPKFDRWSTTGDRFTRDMTSDGSSIAPESVMEIARLIQESKRGIIVVGNLRPDRSESQVTVADTISDFAELVGFPIFAGAPTAALRFRSSAVIPFAEHLLKCPIVAENVQPDLVIQIGAPLVSTEITKVISQSMHGTDGKQPVHHVLIHPHTPQERVDPEFTVTHKVSADIVPFVKQVSRALREPSSIASELAPLVLLGRELAGVMKSIIQDAAAAVDGIEGQPQQLIEPEIILSLAESITSLEDDNDRALFLSNSMPIRDTEFFLYPFSSQPRAARQHGPAVIGTNRGASGIDGIVSSALGFAEASQTPTTLLIGDVSALHDISSLHSLANDAASHKQSSSKRSYPLTTVVVNNNGGGIFSFLPVAKYGNDVSFEEFFGTPTNSFSFGKGSEAFNVAFRRAVDSASFDQVFREAREGGQHNIVEAVVAGRDRNVAAHKHITESVKQFVTNFLDAGSTRQSSPRLSVKAFHDTKDERRTTMPSNRKALVLLHGWMGDKSEWDLVGPSLSRNLPWDWDIIAVDLPGHGSSPLVKSSDVQVVREALNLAGDDADTNLSVDGLADAILSSLSEHHNIQQIDAIAGYSLGGRVATAMLRRLDSSGDVDLPKVILVSSDPGRNKDSAVENPLDNLERLAKDEGLASQIISRSNKAVLRHHTDEGMLLWDDFLDKWYKAPIWGELSQRPQYSGVKVKRCRALQRSGRDLAAVLWRCSPPRNELTFSSLNQLHPNTLFLAGGLDVKYSAIGKQWKNGFGINYKEVDGVGHALLVESPDVVADAMSEFLQSETRIASSDSPNSADTKLNTASDKLIDERMLDEQGHTPSERRRESSVHVEPVEDGITTRSLLGLRFERFSIGFSVGSSQEDSVSGIGWGAAAKASKAVKRRSGVILQIESSTDSGGRAVGIGEVSPLQGLHAETLDDAIQQLGVLQAKMKQQSVVGGLSRFEANEALKLDGHLTQYLERLTNACGIDKMLPSVRSGLEMALLGLAAQKVGQPIHQALAASRGGSQSALLPINGLVTRGVSPGRFRREVVKDDMSFPSLKVKVGHQTSEEDAVSIAQAFQRSNLSDRRGDGMIRADANQAWNESEAIAFASSLDGLEVHALARVEFVEEPLRQQMDASGSWSFAAQVDSLERFEMHSGVPYALDESLAALALQMNYDFDKMEKELQQVFKSDPRRCAAFVLKPALLGFELSWQLAHLARHKFGIGAVFSSSFDSGVGLTYTSFLGALSNTITSSGRTYPHGVGTFALFSGDTLTPSFASYVNKKGELNIASISRAVYGLTLDEMYSSMVSEEPTEPTAETIINEEEDDDDYETSTSSSGSSGPGISVALSIHLPFSAAIAHSRFTDLPQTPRWAPWVSSVAYQGKETEWRLNVRGVPLKWRATSQLIEEPSPGIQWESVSGLINNGVAEFIPDSDDSCIMKVRMSFITPRIFSPIFQGVSVLLEDFVRERLLRWSLESFRDVVKADLAIERGDLELGDALFSAAEGKANAIEATLNAAPSVKDDRDLPWE